MNFNEYKREIKKRILREIDCYSNIYNDEICIRPCHYSHKSHNSKEEILNWIKKNNDYFVIEEIYENPSAYSSEYSIYVKLINCEKYKEESKTKYDEEIEELETKLAELKEKRKEENERKRKQQKIDELKKQLAELEK